MERVAWYPAGLHQHRKREATARVCRLLLALSACAGAAALTVSWLLATGNIDPDRRPEHRIAISSLNKVPRRIDVAGGGQYPNIVSGKDLTDKKSLQNSVILTAAAEEDEDTTEEAPNILEDEGPSDDQNLEVGDGDTELDSFELTDAAQVEILELENFELSKETDSSEAEVAATTLESLEEDLEITTISN